MGPKCSNRKKWFYNFLIIILLIFYVYTDCPFSYYPAQTKIGSLQAFFDNSQIHNKIYQYTQEQKFEYFFEQGTFKKQPQIVLALSNFQYQIKNRLFYDLQYQNSHNFNEVMFKLSLETLQAAGNMWKVLKFNFFASSNQIFTLGSYQSFKFTQQNNQVNLHFPVQKIKNLQISPQNTQFQVYLSGIDIASNLSQNEINNLEKQIDTYRGFGWSSSIIKHLEQRLQARQNLHIEIKAQRINGLGIQLQFLKGQAQILSFLRVSYILWSRKILEPKYFYLSQKINTTNLVQGSTLPVLQHSEMLFTGISSLYMRFWSYHQFEFSIEKQSNNQKVFLRLNDQRIKSVNVKIATVSFSTKPQHYCSDCIDGKLYYQNFCVSQCPKEHIKKLINNSFYRCQKCDIFKGLIPNTAQNKCQCALTFYQSNNNTDNPTCRKCHYSCLTCNNSSNCLTCDNLHSNTNRFLNLTTQKCQCKGGYFENLQSLNIKCQKCHQDCLTCSGKTQRDCLTCPVGRVKSPDGRCMCSTNFQLKNNVCVCLPPNFSFRSNCFKFRTQESCRQNQQQIFKNGQNICKCKQGYQKFKDRCIECGQNQIVSPITQTCECKLGSVRFQNKCHMCKLNQFFNKNTKKCQCKPGFFLDEQDNCITCGKRQILMKGKCICVFNYYKNEENACVRCLQNTSNDSCQPNIF